MYVETADSVCGKPPIQVVANANGVQAVKQSGAGLYYASFAEEGVVDFGAGKAMGVDRALMVMARRDADDGFTIHASNPEHRSLRPDFIAGEGKTVGTLIEEPVSVRITGFSQTKSAVFHFPTERGEEGASVKGRFQ